MTCFWKIRFFWLWFLSIDNYFCYVFFLFIRFFFFDEMMWSDNWLWLQLLRDFLEFVCYWFYVFFVIHFLLGISPLFFLLRTYFFLNQHYINHNHTWLININDCVTNKQIRFFVNFEKKNHRKFNLFGRPTFSMFLKIDFSSSWFFIHSFNSVFLLYVFTPLLHTSFVFQFLFLVTEHKTQNQTIKFDFLKKST